jgi:uncharacterized protein (DUF736 family)
MTTLCSSHRVFVGHAEVGQRGRSNRRRAVTTLPLKLDDPSFTAPNFANLIR